MRSFRLREPSSSLFFHRFYFFESKFVVPCPLRFTRVDFFKGLHLLFSLFPSLQRLTLRDKDCALSVVTLFLEGYPSKFERNIYILRFDGVLRGLDFFGGFFG